MTASRLAAPVGTLAVVGAAFAYVGAVDPSEPGHYPLCPAAAPHRPLLPRLRRTAQRPRVVHGDVAAALGMNALAVAGFALFAAFMGFWLVRVLSSRPMTVPLRSTHWWVLGAVAVAFTVVRNLPWGSALAP